MKVCLPVGSATHLNIEHPNNELFTIKEVSDPKEANATSSIVHSASSSASRENLGDDFVDYEWNGGPIFVSEPAVDRSLLDHVLT